MFTFIISIILHVWNLNKHPEIGFATLVSHHGEESTCAIDDIIITLYRSVPESCGWLVQQNLEIQKLTLGIPLNFWNPLAPSVPQTFVNDLELAFYIILWLVLIYSASSMMARDCTTV